MTDVRKTSVVLQAVRDVLRSPAALRQARLDAGLTQRAVADLLGVSIKTVQSWEGGWRTMPEPMLRLFRRVLDEGSRPK